MSKSVFCALQGVVTCVSLGERVGIRRYVTAHAHYFHGYARVLYRVYGTRATR